MNNLLYIFLFLTVKVSWSIRHNFEDDESQAIVFPGQLPKKQEIPISLVRRINEKAITSDNEFIDNFIDYEPQHSKIEISARMNFEDFERSAVKYAKLAVCMPETTTVPIVSEKDPTVFYYPSCTRVQRCGGCCGHQSLSCQPVESEILHFSVIAAEYRGGSQLKFRNKEVVGIEQHKKCKCDCKVQPEHCGKYQRYNREMCRCECGNTDDEQKCKKDRKTKVWNKDLCLCVCREELECGSGFYFDPFHCRCEQARGFRASAKQITTPWSFNFRRGFYNADQGRSKELEVRRGYCPERPKGETSIL